MPPKYVSGASIKLGTIEISSNVRANTALINPPSENVIDVNTAISMVITGWTGLISVNSSEIIATNKPTATPRATPPITNPANMVTLLTVGNHTHHDDARHNKIHVRDAIHLTDTSAY